MPKKTILALLLIAGPALAAPKLDIAAGDLRFVATTASNMRLELRGVPVFREQSVILVRPGWNGVHLYPEESDPVCTTSVEGDAQVGTVVYDNAKAYLRYRVELRPDNTCRVVARYAMKTLDPAEAEAHVYMNGNLFEGAPIAAENGRGGRVPALALDPDKPSILGPASHLTFQTRLGPVEVVLESADADLKAFRLDDYRASQLDWARKAPTIWFGTGVPRLPSPPAEQSFTLTWRFQPPAAPVVPPVQDLAPRVEAVPAARVSWTPDYPVVPRPKVFSSQGAPLRLPRKVAIAIPGKASPLERQAARELKADLEEIWGVTAAVREGSDAGAQIVLARADAKAIARRAGAIATPARMASLQATGEGYFLETGRAARITANTPRGVYNGAQTLKQLIRLDGAGVFVKPARILDWPSLAMRGVHWFGGRQSLPFHRRMIERIAAPFKMNTMLYEVDYADWDTLKERDAKRGMSKADVKTTVGIARAHGLDPIPLVTSFGNCDWMFVNGQNKDLLYLDNKRSYDPHNPKSYDTLFSVMQEAIDIFQPKYFHIGHDEITTEKPSIPPTGETESAVSLIVNDVTKIRNWLKPKGITAMMWSDELLHVPEETENAGNAPSLEEGRAMRRGIPKDVVIADWHYWSIKPTSLSVPTLQKDGFPVVGATWFERDNTRNFARLLADRKGLGIIQTTWAGWEMSEELASGANPYQFVAYVLGADCAWDGGRTAVRDLGYEPEDVYRAAWERKPARRERRAGFTVALGPARSRVVGGAVFAGIRPTPLADALSGAPAPAAIRLPMNGRAASELDFLWTSTRQTDAEAVVATLRVDYADGRSSEMPIRYARHIFAATDLRAGPETLTVERAAGPAGPTAARLWRWTNPYPKAPMASVTLTSARAEAAPVLMGVTGVQ